MLEGDETTNTVDAARTASTSTMVATQGAHTVSLYHGETKRKRKKKKR